MKRIIALISTIAIGSALLVSNCGKPNKANTVQEDHIVPVNVATVTSGSVENKINFLGDIKAYREVNVYSTIPEKITSLNVDINDIVQKGDVLATVNDVKIRQGVLQAEAGLASAKAQYENVLTEWNRIKRLYNESAVSKSQYDAVRTQKEAAEAAVKQLSAGLKSAKEQLADTKIKAPISGIISARNYNFGDQTSPQYPAFTIVDMDTVKIFIDIVEYQVAQIKEGQKALIRVAGYPNKVFEGVVAKVYPTLNPLSRSVKAEIVIDNEDLLLKPGMYANVDVISDRKDNVPVIPPYCIIEKTNLEYLGGEVSNTRVKTEKYVYVIREDIAYQKQIATGIEEAKAIEIINGINIGDIIVTRGQHDLSDSTPVRIIEIGN